MEIQWALTKSLAEEHCGQDLVASPKDSCCCCCHSLLDSNLLYLYLDLYLSMWLWLLLWLRWKSGRGWFVTLNFAAPDKSCIDGYYHCYYCHCYHSSCFYHVGYCDDEHSQDIQRMMKMLLFPYPLSNTYYTGNLHSQLTIPPYRTMNSQLLCSLVINKVPYVRCSISKKKKDFR